ncbi:MAG: DHH family phosphoesterase [Candidatus Moduliflexus flocculans]|nr:DHH family phosphoesterase [Candidatus Moduliflexus flocculans]
MLNPPRLKIILVDHNEPRQAIAALEEAELLEILDHHRLGNPHTHHADPFHSGYRRHPPRTLVSEQTAEAGLSVPPDLAGTLLAGLLADTLILTSPTTTPRDKASRRTTGALGVRGRKSAQRRDDRILRQGGA